ncbi:unnamed protein product [[Candida] boidinii]|nr:unnamed protein product [[Candida] boidinii]
MTSIPNPDHDSISTNTDQRNSNGLVSLPTSPELTIANSNSNLNSNSHAKKTSDSSASFNSDFSSLDSKINEHGNQQRSSIDSDSNDDLKNSFTTPTKNELNNNKLRKQQQQSSSSTATNNVNGHLRTLSITSNSTTSSARSRSSSYSHNNNTSSNNSNHPNFASGGKKMGLNLNLSLSVSSSNTPINQNQFYNTSNTTTNIPGNNTMNNSMNTPTMNKIRSSHRHSIAAFPSHTILSPSKIIDSPSKLSSNNRNSNSSILTNSTSSRESSPPQTPLLNETDTHNIKSTEGTNHRTTHILDTDSAVKIKPSNLKAELIEAENNNLSNQLRLLASKEMEILDIKQHIKQMIDKKRDLELELRDLKYKVEKSLLEQITSIINICLKTLHL